MGVHRTAIVTLPRCAKAQLLVRAVVVVGFVVAPGALVGCDDGDDDETSGARADGDTADLVGGDGANADDDQSDELGQITDTGSDYIAPHNGSDSSRACDGRSDCAPNQLCDEGACIRVCGSNAIAYDGVCACEPGHDWLSENRDVTDCVLRTGCHLYGQDPFLTYLGWAGACDHVESVCNQASRFGSADGALSIWNEAGIFGSGEGMYSAFATRAAKPPLLRCDRLDAGYVTRNTLSFGASQRVDPDDLCAVCPTGYTP